MNNNATNCFPYIFPLLGSLLIIVFAPSPTDWQNGGWTASAYYEGCTGENSDHTACLRRRADDLRERYLDAVEDFKDDRETAEDIFIEAEIEADAEYWAEMAAIARMPAPPQVKIVLAIAASGKRAFDINMALRAWTRANQEAKSDFEREVGNLDDEHEEDQEDCWNLYVQPLLDLAEQESQLPQQRQPGSFQLVLDDLQNRPRGIVFVIPVN